MMMRWGLRWLTGPSIGLSFLCATDLDGTCASQLCRSLAWWPEGPPVQNEYVALFLLLLSYVPLGVLGCPQ